ncbi:MAG: DoxX family protein [Pseudomonadota bacterium]|nr:DoxX family protein [Pseudomonadota bacterium]
MKKTGWIITALLLAFLLPASVAPKLLTMQVAADTMTQIGWPTRFLVPLGILELLLLALFAWPRTAPLGALLFTGMLGGAMATHLRVGSPLASHTLFGLYLGLFMWLALYLRDPALREFVRGYLRR